MATTAPPTSCVNHRRRPSVATCSTCGSALCADCVVRTGVGIKCRTCTGVKATKPVKVSVGPAGPLKAETPIVTRAAASPGGRKPWAVVLVAAGVLVLAVAGYGLATRGSPPSSKAEQAQGPPAAELVERVTEFMGAGGLRIGGTLTIPPLADGQPVPAVLIIPGLGALDRNGLVAANPPDAFRDALVSTVGGVGLSSPDPLYKDLSEALAGAGIASFRYEKRGTKLSPLPAGQKLSFDDDVTDARAALDLLSKRAEVGAAPIVVLGHDTGGAIAMRVSAGNPRVKAVVAVSLPSRPLGDVFATDMARTRGAAVGDAFRAAVSTLATTGQSPPADSLPDIIRPIFAPGQDLYLKALFALDPSAEVGKVTLPVLLVRGGADPAVTAADTDKLAASLRVGGQVMVGSSEVDHNLAFTATAHEHTNTAAAPAVKRDADTRSALASWVKAQLAS